MPLANDAMREFEGSLANSKKREVRPFYGSAMHVPHSAALCRLQSFQLSAHTCTDQACLRDSSPSHPAVHDIQRAGKDRHRPEKALKARFTHYQMAMAEPSATLEDGRMRNEKISHVDGLSSAQTMRPYIDQERPTEAAQEKIGPTQNTEDPASRTKSNGQAASPPTQGSDPQLLTPSRLHGILLKLAALSTLGIFSFFGVLVRLGLSAIGDYSGRSTFPLLWAQVVGCLIMGAVSERRELIEGV